MIKHKLLPLIAVLLTAVFLCPGVFAFAESAQADEIPIEEDASDESEVLPDDDSESLPSEEDSQPESKPLPDEEEPQPAERPEEDIPSAETELPQESELPSAQLPAPSEQKIHPEQEDVPVRETDNAALLPSAGDTELFIGADYEELVTNVAINAQNFPDDVFRDYVSKRVDRDQNGFLTGTELSLIANLQLANRGIGSLKGIEYFSWLTSLDVNGNDLAALDLSGNPRLTYVSVESNPLSALTFAPDTPLNTLLVWDTRLSSLNLAQFPDLEKFAFGAMPAFSMDTVDFSGNPKLKTLQYYAGSLQSINVTNCPELTNVIIAGCLAEDIDFSHNPALTYFGGSGNRLHTMNFQHNPNLSTVDLSQNELISIHGNNKMPASDFIGAPQNPMIIKITNADGTFDLSSIDPDFASGQVTDVTGGSVSGSVITPDLTVSSPQMTYKYSDGGLEITATLIFDVDSHTNEWTQAPKVDNWTYGGTANLPQAVPLYGDADDVIFEYADRYTPEDGIVYHDFANPPTQAGTYLLRARVPATPTASSLVGYAIFRVYKAKPPYTVPAEITATYRDLLGSTALPSGFSWVNPDIFVGNVGQRTHYADYVPPDAVNYVAVNDIPIVVNVIPKDGALCTISPVTNDEQAANITITDGDLTLVNGTDYTVSVSADGDLQTVTITFIGNYTGTVTRSYKETRPEPPDNPNMPDNPTPPNPEEGTHPEPPDNPNMPDNPALPNPEEGTVASGSPIGGSIATGDDAYSMPMLIAAAVSAAAVIAAAVFMRNRTPKRKDSERQ